jgi:hypothetical protein
LGDGIEEGDGDDAEQGLRDGNVEDARAHQDDQEEDGQHNPASGDQAAQVGQMVGVFVGAGKYCHGRIMRDLCQFSVALRCDNSPQLNLELFAC